MPPGFRGENFLISANRKQEFPMATMLLTNRDEMRKSYRGPSKLNVFCIILLYLAKWFQNRRFLEIYQPETKIGYGGNAWLLTDRDKINTFHR